MPKPEKMQFKKSLKTQKIKNTKCGFSFQP